MQLEILVFQEKLLFGRMLVNGLESRGGLGSLRDLARHVLARPFFTASIVSMTRDGRDKRVGLVDFLLRAFPNPLLSFQGRPG